jgi:hypothetical protein
MIKWVFSLSRDHLQNQTVSKFRMNDVMTVILVHDGLAVNKRIMIFRQEPLTIAYVELREDP